MIIQWLKRKKNPNYNAKPTVSKVNNSVVQNS